MRAKTTLTILTALGLGLGAAWLAANWAEARLSGKGSEAGLPVVVAAMEVPFGKLLEAADVRVVRMPHEAVPKGNFSAIDEVLGRVATQTLYSGEVLVDGRVVEHAGGSALAAVISKDRRAVTVRVDDVVGVAGFLLPGNRVDVIASKKEADRKVVSYTLLEDKKVLAVDQTASPEKDDPVIVRAVTLELTPEEAENLVKATKEGTVQMALRNPLDEKKVTKKPEPKPVVKKPYVPTTTYVTVIKGVEVERYRVKM